MHLGAGRRHTPKEGREPLPRWWEVHLPKERKSVLETLGHTDCWQKTV